MKSFAQITAILIFICIIIQKTHCLLSPCVGVFKASRPCLEFVKRNFEDANAYWFGTAYTTTKKCGYQDAIPIGNGEYVSSRDVKCMNQRPADKSGTYLSVGSRIWVDNDYTSDRYLNDVVGIVDVQYHSPPGIVSYCKHFGEDVE